VRWKRKLNGELEGRRAGAASAEAFVWRGIKLPLGQVVYLWVTWTETTNRSGWNYTLKDAKREASESLR